MENRYVSKQKHGNKIDLCEEDKEDFEQERLIQEWLKHQGMSGAIELKHISRKGTARNTLDTRSLRLDQKMFDDNDPGTLADSIAGSDGRDLECRLDGPEVAPSAEDKVCGYLSALGFNNGELKWLIKIMLKSSIQASKSHLEKLATPLESWKQFEPFST